MQGYPFLSVLGTLIVIFAYAIWFWMLIVIFGDLFRRADISGWAKAGWVICLVVLPFLGTLIYLISQSAGMAGRQAIHTHATQSQHARSGNGSSPASEIETAKHLLDSGSITNEEFDVIKRKAIVSG
jgi:energy-coupling factor transporter transmembrane protein EcfT